MADQIATEYQKENRHLTAGGDFLCPKGDAFHLEVKLYTSVRMRVSSRFYPLEFEGVKKSILHPAFIQRPSKIIVVDHLLRHAAVNTDVFSGDKAGLIGAEI